MATRVDGEYGGLRRVGFAKAYAVMASWRREGSAGVTHYRMRGNAQLLGLRVFVGGGPTLSPSLSPFVVF